MEPHSRFIHSHHPGIPIRNKVTVCSYIYMLKHWPEAIHVSNPTVAKPRWVINSYMNEPRTRFHVKIPNHVNTRFLLAVAAEVVTDAEFFNYHGNDEIQCGQSPQPHIRLGCQFQCAGVRVYTYKALHAPRSRHNRRHGMPQWRHCAAWPC